MAGSTINIHQLKGTHLKEKGKQKNTSTLVRTSMYVIYKARNNRKLHVTTKCGGLGDGRDQF